MKILIMPDSFKGSLSAKEAARIIGKSFTQVFPTAEIELLPVGDGGEGTLDALAQTIKMKEKWHTVSGWNGEPFSMRYMQFQDQAFFEMADLVGLPMFSAEQRQPLDILTVGLGELILHLQTIGMKKIYVGVGGSATVDGGIGLAAGLGYRFYDRSGQLLKPTGRNLAQVAKIDAAAVPELTSEIYAVTDVKNILCGKTGASSVFGPQKGLKTIEIPITDQALKQFYQLVEEEVLNLAGGGAGGGLAAGIAGFAKGHIIHGIDFVLDVLEFDRRAQSANLIIVGEGKMDQQSMSGKAPVGIALRAPKDTIVIAICGSVDQQNLNSEAYGITACFPIIGQPGSLEEALESAETNLEQTSLNIAKYHYLAWKQLADQLNIHFTKEDNERLKGVSREKSLEILLSLGNKTYTKDECTQFMTQKNEAYVRYISKMDEAEILPGVKELLNKLKTQNIKIALGSASKNAALILKNTNLQHYFDAIVDGNNVSKAKPDPEVFLLGAYKIGAPAEKCMVFEDAQAGIEAAKRAGMLAIGVGTKENLPNADILVETMNDVDLAKLN